MTRTDAESCVSCRCRQHSGVAVLLVLAVIAIVLALSYATSRSTSTMSAISAHETCGLEARSAVAASVGPTMNNLSTSANWMPSSGPARGTFDSGEEYQVDVRITEQGGGRSIEAAAQVFDLSGYHVAPYQSDGSAHGSGSESASRRPVADQHLQIKLTKQTRNDLPNAAIMAFDDRPNSLNGPSVYVASGNSIHGNVRSSGPIHFQAGFVLAGIPYVMSGVSRHGTDTSGYTEYRASWGDVYSAGNLAQHGTTDNAGRLILDHVTLGPSDSNPMGVFYYQGLEVVLGDNVSLHGTLAVRGNLTIRGNGVHLIALERAEAPSTETLSAPPADTTQPTGLINTLLSSITQAPPEPSESNTSVKTSFPVVVVDGDLTIHELADVVRVSGVIVVRETFRRVHGDTGLLACLHNHSLALDLFDTLFSGTDGPAIYIRGAIMAGAVSLQHRPERPLALVYDATFTNVADAPGFFTWRVSDWCESN